MLAWCLGWSRCRRQRRSRRNRRVILKRSPSHWLFTILIDIKIFSRSIKTHATKLNRSSVHGMICRHHHCFLLLHDSPGDVGSASRAARSSCSIRSIARYARCWSCSWYIIGRGVAGVLCACGGAGGGRRSWRMGCIWQLLEIRLRQLVLGGCQNDGWL